MCSRLETRQRKDRGQDMYDIEYNGRSGRSYGIIPVRRPSVPAPEPRVTETEIPGRDGALIETDGAYELIEIPIEFNFLRPPDQWMGVYHEAKKWLSGSGWLKLGDYQSDLYKVLYIRIADTERASRRLGKFTAEFVCDPYAYIADGQKEKAISEVEYNPYATSHPIYKIKGSGTATLTVNGKIMKATVSGEITIDTDRMIAYNASGVGQNTALSGDYEDLYLIEGDNTITVTSGFTVTVIPNWREL